MKKSLFQILFFVALWLFAPIGLSAMIYVNENFNSCSADAVPANWDNKSLTDIPDLTYRWVAYDGPKGLLDGNCMRFNSYYPAKRKYDALKSPEIVLPAGVNAELIFMYKNPKGGKMELRIEHDGSYDTLSTKFDAVTEWTEFIFPLEKYSGKTIRVVWYSVSNCGSGDAYHYLDNVVVRDVALCQAPAGITVASPSQTSVVVSWNLDRGEAVPDTYKLRVAKKDGTVVVSNDNIKPTALAYTITGLEAGTTYDLTLQGDCQYANKGFSDVSSPVEFSTLLAPITLPYRQSFDEVSLPLGMLSTGDVVPSDAFRVGTSGYSLKARAGALVVFPQMAHPANDVQLRAMVRATTTNPEITLGLMAEPSDLSSFEPVKTITIPTGEWVDLVVNTSSFAYPDVDMALAIKVTDGRSQVFYFDDVVISQIPTCPRPENLNCISSDSVSATISWTGTQGVKQIVVETETSAQVKNTQVLDVVTPMVINGLSDDTDYKIRIREICAAGDTSDWSTYAKFHTTCRVMESPLFVQDFEIAPRTGEVLPNCWSQYQISAPTSGTDLKDKAWKVRVDSYFKTSGKNSIMLEHYGAGARYMLVSQPINIDKAGKYDLAYYIRRNSSCKNTEGVVVWVNNRPDTIGAQKCGFVSANYKGVPVVDKGSVFYRYEHNIEKSGVVYIMFESISDATSASNYAMYIDDIQVYLAPTCRSVDMKSIAIKDVTTSSARLAWDALQNHNEFKVSYSLVNESGVVLSDTKIINTPYIDFTGLSSMHHYDVTGTIAPICAIGDTAVSTNFKLDFSTACEPLNIGFVQDFESSYFLPVCWTATDASRWSRNTNTQYAFATASARVTGGSGGSELLVSPQVNIPTSGSYEVHFKMYRRYPISVTDTIEGIRIWINNVPNTVDATQLIYLRANRKLDLVESAVGVYEYFAVIPSTYTGLQYLIIEGVTNGHDNGIFIDDIGVRVATSCPKVREFNVVADQPREAHVDVAESFSFQIEYGLSGFEFGKGQRQLFNNTQSGVIAGLEPNTKYDVYLRKVCAVGDSSLWSDPVTFTTPCELFEVTEANPYFEGFESYKATEEIVGCFTKVSAPEGVYNTKNTASASNAPYGIAPYEGGIYCEQKWGFNSWLFRPMKLKAGVNYEISGQFIKDSRAGSSAYASLAVANTDAVYDVAPDQLVSRVQLVEAAQWKYVQSYFTVATDGVYYLGWRVEQGFDGNYTGMDNLRVRVVSCIPPSGALVSSISGNSATLSWNSNASEWDVLVTTGATNPEVPQNVVFHQQVTAPTAVITGLTPNTEYHYYLQSICNGNKAVWSEPGIFRTLCAATPAPYSIDFDDYQTTMDKLLCWTVNPGIDQSGNKVGQAAWTDFVKYQGTGSFEVKNSMVILPQLDVVSLKDYMITGWASANVDSMVFAVGVMSDPADVTTYEVLGNVSLANANSWQEFTTYFTKLATPDYVDFANAKYVVINVTSEKDICWLDNIAIKPIPSCLKPTESAISNITSDGFTLSWLSNSSESSWIVKVDNKGVVTEYPVTTNPATISGLLSNTDYHVSIAAVCSESDKSDYADCGSFTTLCAPYTVPYNLVLDGVAEEALPDCWSIEKSLLTDMYQHDWYVVHNPELALNAKCFAAGARISYSQLCSPVFNMIDMVAPVLTVDVKVLNSDTLFILGRAVGSASLDTLAFAVGSADPIAARQTISCSLKNYEGKMMNVIFEANKTTNDMNGGTYLYKMSIDADKSCVRPQSLNLVKATDMSLTVDVIDEEATHTQWEVVCVPAGQPIDGVAPALYQTKQFTIEGLSANTPYDVYVRTKCADADYSYWRGPIRMRTECGMYNVPYAQSFENADDLSSTCFTFYNLRKNGKFPNASISANVNYVSDGKNTLYLQSSQEDTMYIVLPQFDKAINSLRLSFDYRNESTSAKNGTLMVGMMTNASDTKTFKLLHTCEKVNAMTNVVLDMDLLVKENIDGRIVFAYKGNMQDNWYAGLDNIKVEALPSCPPVLGLEALSIASDNAVIKMLNSRKSTAYQVAYDVQNVEPAACANKVIVNADSVTLNALSPATTYYMYARSVCAVGDTSVWSPMMAFTTSCEPIEVTAATPYTENFDGCASMVEPFPLCFTRLVAGTDDAGVVYPRVDTQNGKLHFKGKSAVMLPKFNLRSDKLVLEFDYHGYGWLLVGVTDKPDFAARQAIGEADVYMEESVQHYKFDLSTASAVGDYIVIHINDYCYGYIDNIKVSKASECYVPRMMSVTGLTSESAVLHWHSGTDDVAIEYEFTAPSGVTTNQVTVDSVEFKNLLPATVYSVRLRSMCAPGQFTDWSEVFQFTTLARPATAPYSTSFDDDTDNAMWMFVNGNNADKFIVGADAAALDGSAKALYVSNDGTSYAYSGSQKEYYGVWKLETFYAYRQLVLEPGEYSLTLKWKGSGAVRNNKSNFGRVFMTSSELDIVPGAKFEDVSSNMMLTERLLNANAWQTDVKNFVVLNKDTYNIVIAWQQDTDPSASTPLAVELFEVSKMPCAGIYNVKVADITSTTITVDYQNINAAGNTQYYVTQNGKIVGDTAKVTYDVQRVTVSGLQPNSDYVVHLRAACDGKNGSAWVETPVVTTDCAPIVVNESTPYIESFETYAENNSRLDMCWIEEYASLSAQDVFRVNTKPYVGDNAYKRAAKDGNQYVTLRYEAVKGIMYRDFEFEADATYEISLWSVVDKTDPDCKVSFVLNRGMDKPDSVLTSMQLPPEYAKMSTEFYAKEAGVYTIGIRVDLNTKPYYATLDLFEIKRVPLAKPVNFNVNNITTERAEFDWVSFADTTQFRLLQGSNVVVDTLLTAKSFVAEKLTPATKYTAQVRSRNIRVSNWEELSFYTLCDVQDAPYSENFNDVVDANLPCWVADHSEVASGATVYEHWMVNTIENGERGLYLRVSNTDAVHRMISNRFRIPFNNLKLSFDYAVHSPYDSLQVYISEDGGNTYSATVLRSIKGVHSRSIEYDLSAYVGKTISVVFVCDASIKGVNNYVFVDNFRISCVDNTPKVINDAVCPGNAYKNHGFDIPASQLVNTGQYKFERIGVSEQGCDQKVILNLTVKTGGTYRYSKTICVGDVYTDENFPDGLTQTGRHVKNLVASSGCDSIVELNLLVRNPFSESSKLICEGDTYDFNGQILNQTGTYYDTIPNPTCDSIAILHLTVLQREFNTSKVVCQGDKYIWIDTVLTTSGHYERHFVNILDCDSIHSIDFTVLDSVVTIDTTICYGQSYVLGTNMYEESGTYTARFENSLKCDSTVILNLTVSKPDTVTVSDVVCAGRPYNGHGQLGLEVNSDTVINSVMKDKDGCAYIQTLSLDYVEAIVVDTVITIKDGEKFDFCGNSIVKAGNYECVLTSTQTGCDSIVHLKLEVLTGVDNIVMQSLVVAPNPILRGDEAIIHHTWSDEEMNGMRLEISDALGRVVYAIEPNQFPISISGIDVSGVYNIRIVTGTGQVYFGRLIVK